MTANIQHWYRIVGMARRNMHRSMMAYKPVIVYFALALAAVMLGNGFIAQADGNLEAVYPGGISGDFCVFSGAAENPTLFGSASALGGENARLPALPDFARLRECAEGVAGVEASLGLVVGPVLVDWRYRHIPAYAFGAERDEYFAFFPALKRTAAGSDGGAAADSAGPSEADSGLWASAPFLETLAQEGGSKLSSGERIGLLFAADQNFQMASLPYRGSIDYGVPVSVVDNLLVLDAASARHLFRLGAEAAGSGKAEPPVAAGEQDLFGQGEMALFGYESAAPVEVAEAVATSPGATSPVAAAPRGGAGSAAQADAELWNCLSLRLAPGADRGRTLRELRESLARQGFSVQVMDWRSAAGGSALYVLWVQGALGAGVVILMLIGVVSLMNILTGISIERSGEIGTMRALGAQKSTVQAMFVLETLMVAGIAALIAAALALGASLALRALDLRVGNQILAIVLGGTGIGVRLEPAAMAAQIGAMAGLTALGTILPVAKVLKLSAQDAMGASLA